MVALIWGEEKGLTHQRLTVSGPWLGLLVEGHAWGVDWAEYGADTKQISRYSCASIGLASLEDEPGS